MGEERWRARRGGGMGKERWRDGYPLLLHCYLFFHRGRTEHTDKATGQEGTDGGMGGSKDTKLADKDRQDLLERNRQRLEQEKAEKGTGEPIEGQS
jgi:hypothetical protein